MAKYFGKKTELSSEEEKFICELKDIILDFIYFTNYVEKKDIKYLSNGEIEETSLVSPGKTHEKSMLIEAMRNNFIDIDEGEGWVKMGTMFEVMQWEREIDKKKDRFHILNDYRPYCIILSTETQINTGLKDRIEKKFGEIKSIPVKEIENALNELRFQGFLIERIERRGGKVTGHGLTEKGIRFYESNGSFYSLYKESTFKKIGSKISKGSLAIAILSFLLSLFILSTANWDKIKVNLGIDEPKPQEIKIITD